VDTAKLMEGRIATASPPCPVLLRAGLYAFLDAVGGGLGLIFGQIDPGLVADVNVVDVLGLAIPYVAWNPFAFAQSYCLPVYTGSTFRVTVTNPATGLTLADTEFTGPPANSPIPTP